MFARAALTRRLITAIVKDDLAEVRAALAAGADVDRGEGLLGRGSTPLSCAASCGRAAIVRELLTHGARPTALALEQAAQHGHAHVVAELLSAGCPLGQALKLAAIGRRPELVDMLIAAGANLDEAFAPPITAWRIDPRCLAKLRDAGAKLPDDAAAMLAEAERNGRLEPSPHKSASLPSTDDSSTVRVLHDAFDKERVSTMWTLAQHLRPASSSGLARVSVHAHRAVAYGILDHRSACTDELSQMLRALEPIVESQASFASDPWVRSPGLAEHMLETQALLHFCTSIALLRGDERVLDGLRRSWLESTASDELVEVSLGSRSSMSAVLAMHRGEPELARTHLDTSIEQLELEYEDPLPEIPTYRALAGILGADPRATNAALLERWNDKLEQIAYASSNVHGLLGGSILGEELEVLAMLAERAGMPIERPPGPRYWW